MSSRIVQVTDLKPGDAFEIEGGATTVVRAASTPTRTVLFLSDQTVDVRPNHGHVMVVGFDPDHGTYDLPEPVLDFHVVPEQTGIFLVVRWAENDEVMGWTLAQVVDDGLSSIADFRTFDRSGLTVAIQAAMQEVKNGEALSMDETFTIDRLPTPRP